MVSKDLYFLYSCKNFSSVEVYPLCDLINLSKPVSSLSSSMKNSSAISSVVKTSSDIDFSLETNEFHSVDILRKNPGIPPLLLLVVVDCFLFCFFLALVVGVLVGNVDELVTGELIPLSLGVDLDLRSSSCLDFVDIGKLFTL